MGIPLISGKSRLVKYYNLARWIHLINRRKNKFEGLGVFLGGLQTMIAAASNNEFDGEFSEDTCMIFPKQTGFVTSEMPKMAT